MIPITTDMRDYLSCHPGLRYLFFGGKGGVGKTALAGATALWLAEQGRRTLVASTNPVHSLSSLLGQDVLGREVPVLGAANLSAYEIETSATVERAKKEIREKINWFLKFSDITAKADGFVESATMNPAFEESAMFENMVDLMMRGEYQAYVFDTAPTANARRLLGMSKVYSLWVEKMLRSREQAKSLREMLSFSKKKEQDPLLDYLLGFRERMGKAKDLLTDAERTAFFFATLPEALPIAVIRRFMAWFQDFGIPVGGVVVNGVITGQTPEASGFVASRVRMQQGYLEQIRQAFGDQVRALVPLFDAEVRGLAMLRQMAQALFGDSSQMPETGGEWPGNQPTSPGSPL